jgi:transketolase
MAIAERRLAFEFNQPGHDLIDHRTYVICSDGDLQEGIASEACRSPGISGSASSSRSGTTTGSSSTGRRRGRSPRTSSAAFAAYGWHTQRVEDGNDIEAIAAAIEAAQADDRPIDHRRPHAHRLRQPQRQDSQKAHGQPLGPTRCA